MQPDELEPVAAHLIASYSDTAIYSRHFRDEHETPPSLMAKVHHLRSIVQARLATDERFELAPSFAEYGRVEFTALGTGRKFLLRSAGTLAVGRAKRRDKLALFAASKFLKTSDVQMLIYEFDRDGLSLSLAASAYRVGGKRLVARGEPTPIGFWPYLPSEVLEGGSFDQDVADPFSDVGDLDEGGEESGGAV